MSASAADAADLLDHSVPGDTEVVAKPPRRLYLYFTEPVLFDDIRLTDALGKPIYLTFGKPEDDVSEIEIWLYDDLLPGRYELSYRLTHDTIHPGGEGAVRFSVAER